jgi:hypothetical protein
LKCCFIVELFEKWRFLLPPSHTRAPHSGDSFGCLVVQLATLHVGESPNSGATQGVAWVALSRAFPQTQGISFLSRSPSLHDIWPVFLMLYYFSRTVMAILCCVAQKAASAPHSESLNILLGPFQIFFENSCVLKSRKVDGV